MEQEENIFDPHLLEYHLACVAEVWPKVMNKIRGKMVWETVSGQPRL